MSLSIFVDIAIAVIFVVIIAFSVKKGFAISLLQFISLVLSVLLAIKLSTLFSPYVYQLFEKKIVSSIASTISNAGNSLSLSEKALVVLGEFPKVFAGFAKLFGMNLADYSNYLYPANNTESGVAQEIADKMVYPVALKICNIVISVIIFILLFIILRLISKAISKLFKKLPIVGTADKLLGALLGMAKCVVFIMIFSAIIYIGLNVIQFKTDKIPSVLYDSKILSLSYKYNPLISLLISK